MDQRKELDELYGEYRLDPAFSNLKNMYGINFVPGSGPFSPSVMLIGTSPGKFENRKRLPFMGPQSRYLKKVIYNVGINYSNIFLTNVIKYWPQNPTNRDQSRRPTDAELEASKHYIEEEIDIIDPIYVGLCGQLAIQAMCPEIDDVYSVNGQLIDHKYVALYDPAILRHDGSSEKWQIVEHGYRELKRLIDESERAA